MIRIPLFVYIIKSAFFKQIQCGKFTLYLVVPSCFSLLLPVLCRAPTETALVLSLVAVDSNLEVLILMCYLYLSFSMVTYFIEVGGRDPFNSLFGLQLSFPLALGIFIDHVSLFLSNGDGFKKL